GHSRAQSVHRDRDGVTVTLTDGQTINGSHCLMTVGMIPRTESIGCDEAGVQGRIAMWHTLGEAVHPIRLGHVAATIFTNPEIATVGVSQRAVDAGEV